MNQVDSFSHAYLGIGEICVDVINFICFDGKPVVKTDNLSGNDTRVT